MAHFLPPEHVRQVNKLEWPKVIVILVLQVKLLSGCCDNFAMIRTYIGKIYERKLLKGSWLSTLLIHGGSLNDFYSSPLICESNDIIVEACCASAK